MLIKYPASKRLIKGFRIDACDNSLEAQIYKSGCKFTRIPLPNWEDPFKTDLCQVIFTVFFQLFQKNLLRGNKFFVLPIFIKSFQYFPLPQGMSNCSEIFLYRFLVSHTYFHAYFFFDMIHLPSSLTDYACNIYENVQLQPAVDTIGSF